MTHKRIAPVRVIVDHSPEDRVAHAAVQLEGVDVICADKQVDKPGALRLALRLERARQLPRVARTPRGRRNRQRRDVRVPGQVMRVRVGAGRVGRCRGLLVRGRGFDLAEDWTMETRGRVSRRGQRRVRNEREGAAGGEGMWVWGES